MSLDESQNDLDSNLDESACLSKDKVEKEEFIRKLTNKILDETPDIVDDFNKGNTSAITKVVSELQSRIDFDISEEAIRNIIGEEILIR